MSYRTLETLERVFGYTSNSSTLCQLRKQMEELEEAHMLRGELTATEQLSLISSYDDLAQALEGAFFVQVLDNPPPQYMQFCLFILHTKIKRITD